MKRETKIKNPERLIEELKKIRDATLSILEKMKETAETRDLKDKLLKCDGGVELLEIVNEILHKDLIQINGDKYLTEDEVENLKDACETSEEKSIVRDLTDTGMRLNEVLKKERFPDSR